MTDRYFMLPNESLEPTAVGADGHPVLQGSVGAIDILNPAWLSFIRQAP
jgi:hypothetical protein